jgi:hypothetical protein
MDESHRQHPGDRDVLMAPVSITRDTGYFSTAFRHARKQAALDSADIRFRSLPSKFEKCQAR